MENPFFFQGTVPLEVFSCVRRKALIEQLVARMVLGQYIQVTGSHQSGRTTLAHQLIERVVHDPKLGFMPVRIACGGLAAVGAAAFANSFITRIGEVSQAFLDESLLDRVMPRLRLVGTNVWYDLHRTLVDVGSLLDSQPYSAFLLVFDDVEAMLENTVRDALSFLRALYEQYSAMRGRAPYRVIIMTPRDMQRWNLGHRSPFNISSVVPMPAFTEQEFDEMLDDDHAGQVLGAMRFSEGARTAVFRESGGNPYFIQRLCHAMVEKAQSAGTAVTLEYKDAVHACVRLFEHGDESIRKLNHDLDEKRVPQEWDLCKRLACGKRIPYRGVQTEMDCLAGSGVIGDKDGFCHIPIGLYRRRIINRCYNERYSELDEVFNDRERVLLSLSSIQAVLLDESIRSIIVERLRLGSDDVSPREAESYAPSITDLLKGLPESGRWNLDLEEVNVFLEYYRERRAVDLDEIIGLLAKWFAMVLPNEQRAAPFLRKEPRTE